MGEAWGHLSALLMSGWGVALLVAWLVVVRLLGDALNAVVGAIVHHLSIAWR